MAKGKKPMSRTLRIYQKAAIVFIIVAFLSLLVVLYLSVSRATIRITPVESVVSTDVSVEVTPEPKTVGQVSGYILKREYQKAKTFFIPEEGATAKEQNAKGIVTLINETNSNQQLVATTRLLSEEGVLFRLEEGVTVPANGQLEVAVYADETGLSGEIGPSQFTIPGLTTSMQSVIYAVSVDSMQGGIEYIREVSQADLDSAISKLSDEILSEADIEMRAEINDEEFDGSAFESTVLERVSNVSPGDHVGSFTISSTVEVVGVFYDTSVISEYTEAELYSQIKDGYEIITVNTDGMQTNVKVINVDDELAVLEVYLDGFAIISTSNDFLDKSRMIGKSAQEVITFLEASSDIDSARVSFTPFWLKRLPTLKDHIHINIDGLK